MVDEEKTGGREAKIGFGQQLGPWQVLMYWPDDQDQGGPVSMTITPTKDATDDELIGGLSSTWLRQIDFAAAREKWVASKNPDDPWAIRTIFAEQTQRILGRDGVSDGYLANLANLYVHLVRNGERSVAAKLSELVGRSPDTMKQHLHRVRKAGFLTTVPGKAGGQLTQKAFNAMRQANPPGVET